MPRSIEHKEKNPITEAKPSKREILNKLFWNDLTKNQKIVTLILESFNSLSPNLQHSFLIKRGPFIKDIIRIDSLKELRRGIDQLINLNHLNEQIQEAKRLSLTPPLILIIRDAYFAPTLGKTPKEKGLTKIIPKTDENIFGKLDRPSFIHKRGTVILPHTIKLYKKEIKLAELISQKVYEGNIDPKIIEVVLKKLYFGEDILLSNVETIIENAISELGRKEKIKFFTEHKQVIQQHSLNHLFTNKEK